MPLALVLALGVTSTAQASDASLTRALRVYKARLTTDIGYLSGFSAPSRRAAPGALRTLSRVSGDLSGAIAAADRQRASTSSGRTGRSQVLTALHYAVTAAGAARASATAARAGSRSRAAAYARAEQRAIDRAIPLFEAGGRRLHLF